MNNRELYHHGIPGQKWHRRRYQNEDGSWTSAGRARYGKGGAPRGTYNVDHKTASENSKSTSKTARTSGRSTNTKPTESTGKKKFDKKKALKVAGIVAGASLAAYGGYKLKKLADAGGEDLAKEFLNNKYDLMKGTSTNRTYDEVGKEIGKIYNAQGREVGSAIGNAGKRLWDDERAGAAEAKRIAAERDKAMNELKERAKKASTFEERASIAAEHKKVKEYYMKNRSKTFNDGSLDVLSKHNSTVERMKKEALSSSSARKEAAKNFNFKDKVVRGASNKMLNNKRTGDLGLKLQRNGSSSALRKASENMDYVRKMEGSGISQEKLDEIRKKYGSRIITK